jgi:hypothetical protein
MWSRRPRLLKNSREQLLHIFPSPNHLIPYGQFIAHQCGGV